MFKIHHHEFWPARWFELPAYSYLTGQCLRHGVGLQGLFRANYGLKCGVIQSKYQLQQTLGAATFPPTLYLRNTETIEAKTAKACDFVSKHAFPLILKPDWGFTGRGAFKVDNQHQLEVLLPRLKLDYLLQAFVPFAVECGVFYARQHGRTKILSINQKHFPTVIGDGHSTLRQLVEAHPRRTHFWNTYLNSLDLHRVLKPDETQQLSWIGSHTLGCCFTHNPELITPALTQAVEQVFANQPGINYGRLDLVADSLADLSQGHFRVIEFNGIAALPTSMFDPRLSLWQSYRIFFDHLKTLTQIAAEHRHQTTTQTSFRAFWRRSFSHKKAVEAQQDALETLPNLRRL